MRYNSILEAVGKTPLIRLNKLVRSNEAQLYVKCEYLNPGGSVKDRIGITMIEAAEKEGRLKSGATIIEATSGNTGFGLALVCVVRGYKMIFTIPDKQSREKINMMKALGAEVIVCPTAVAPEDPRSYYSVARKLSEEIPNSYYPNQYANPNNPAAHYATTGPEIWQDAEGRITHFVAGLGTGGTISGVGRYLKEKNAKIKIIGADPYGSLYYEYFKTGKIGTAETYVVEGIGEDIIPATIDFSYIDEVVRVTDKDSFITARAAAREEGIFAGGSAGSALWAALEVTKAAKKDSFIVCLLPDTGMRYLSKLYNDDWMRENRYIASRYALCAGDILKSKKFQKILYAKPSDSVLNTWRQMTAMEISQMPVMEKEIILGSISEDKLSRLAMEGANLAGLVVREVMGEPLPEINADYSAEELLRAFNANMPAVLVKANNGNSFGVLTKYDVVHALYDAIGQHEKP